MDERYLYSCHSVLFLELRRGEAVQYLDAVMNCPEKCIPEHSYCRIMYTQDFETLGHSIPDRCVPTLDCKQAVAVVNHNIYSYPQGQLT
jgi:hypothetical protein